MLFSNDRVADFINRHFEPVWESVRPVPLVRIDFGAGNVVTRTLHGNIATYLTDADGLVLDILPGLYDAETYVSQLEQLRRLATYASTQGSEALAEYHQRQAASLKTKGQPEYLHRISLGTSITGREMGVKIVLEPTRRLQARSASLRRPSEVRPPGQPVRRGATEQPSTPSDKLLAQDTQVNETLRRQMIHAYLAEHPGATPNRMTKWLYREVLKADLDDPYLGLGKLLFGNQLTAGEAGQVAR
ncbi:MAG: hypothetical protein CL681_26985 [Blastopirellula sp.]|nr:hypothetical protein [Blastopirellula sp.]